MPVKRLKQLLDQEHIPYESVSHSPAYTAQKIAASAHIPGKELAKSVMVKVNGRLIMTVLPASYHVSLRRLREAIGGEGSVELADEWEFSHYFPGCEIGAMPPFGNLYGVEVFVARELSEDEVIVFNAGSHTELICMAYRDWERLVQPKVRDFALKDMI
jgi:Ala-tRNA(Pro) deacylase